MAGPGPWRPILTGSCGRLRAGSGVRRPRLDGALGRTAANVGVIPGEYRPAGRPARARSANRSGTAAARSGTGVESWDDRRRGRAALVRSPVAEGRPLGPGRLGRPRRGVDRSLGGFSRSPGEATRRRLLAPGRGVDRPRTPGQLTPGLTPAPALPGRMPPE